jgi:methylated-DNA-[protein]-cysteine S-methyltransferase
MPNIAAAQAPAWSATLRTPFAVLGIRTNGHSLTAVRYLSADEPELPPSDRAAEQAVHEIEHYLADPQFRFAVAMAPKGTAFQHRVWDAIAAIPAGESRTYGELAKKLMSAPRAVGQACGSNPLALVIPCHRVVGSGGALGGFMHAAAGSPLGIKRWLLTHEGYRFGRD